MEVHSLLTERRVRCRATLKSRTRVLQALATLLAEDLPASTVESDDMTHAHERLIFDRLAEREQLGSTALGHGVALPHARIEGIERPVGALLTLASGVDFDAPDGAAVDLVFGLLVPADEPDEHLKILAALAERLADDALRARLRACSEREVCTVLADLRGDASAA